MPFPLVGVTTSYCKEKGEISLRQRYFQALTEWGAAPILLPPLGDRHDLTGLFGRLRGILFTGGPDVDPRYYGEDPHGKLGRVCPVRDRAEIMLARISFETNIPILGICRGLQVINVALGGTLYQDIPSYVQAALKHNQQAPRNYATHDVHIFKDTMLHGVLNADQIRVNSFHHQAVKDLAPSLRVAAVAPDGVIEALESKNRGKFCVGVQWHPEEMTDVDTHQRQLFKEFVGVLKLKKDKR